MKYLVACRYFMMHAMMLASISVGSFASFLRDVPRERFLQEKLKVGMNVMLTNTNDDISADEVDRVTKMWTKAIEDEGGIQVGTEGKSYPVDLIILDDENDIEKGKKNAQDLIDQGVIAAVGPYWSTRAIPVSEVMDDLNTTMIAPASTSPATTIDRPYIFRAAISDSFQGPMIARFLSEHYEFKNAAVVHECDDQYSSALAAYFKEEWESEDYGGNISVDTCLETSLTDEQLSDALSSTAATVAQSGADFLFLPVFDDYAMQFIQELNSLPEWGAVAVEKQANSDVATKLIVLGDSPFYDPALVDCAESCEGVASLKLFDPNAEGEMTKKFVSDFATLYDGLVPTNVEALTWDSLNLIKNAIEKCGEISGDVNKDRECVKDAMTATKDFPGVTGDITFDSNGDPMKCVNFVKFVSGEFQPLAQVCPDIE